MGSSNATRARNISGTTTSTGSKSLRQKNNQDGSDSGSNPESNTNTNKSHSNSNSIAVDPHSRLPSQSNGSTNQESQTNSNGSSSSAISKPSVVCLDGNSVFAAMVGRVVKNSIFPKKQFLIFDRELDENSKVADICFKHLQFERSKWHSVKKLVRVRINRVRNNAQLCVRKKLYRKFV